MTEPIYIVSGIPGAGKTTVSRLLAATFPRGVHIESDLLQHQMIVSGGVWPQEQPAEEAVRQVRLRTHNASILAKSFADSAFTVVIDDTVIGGRLNDFLEELTDRSVGFVMLLPRVEVVQQRDAERTEKHVFEIWGYLDAEARSMPRVGLWLDTSDLTAEDRGRDSRAALRDVHSLVLRNG